MFCAHCGNEVPDNVKFCGRCGTSIHPQTITANAPNTPELAANTSRSGKARNFFLWTALIVAVLIIASAVIAAIRGPEAVNTDKLIVNFLLGIFSYINILAIPGGIVAGVIYISKMLNEQGPPMRKYYRTIALWWFFGPILSFVIIIVLYTIVNVIYNLAK